MGSLLFDVAHLLAGGLVFTSLVMLYQARLPNLIRVYGLQALLLTLSVAWQAYAQDAPHLYVTAAITLAFKALIIPVALLRMIERLGIHRQVESALSTGLTMMAGIGLIALSMVVMLRVTSGADPLAREEPRLRPLRGAAGPPDDGDTGAMPSVRWWASCRWRTG